MTKILYLAIVFTMVLAAMCYFRPFKHTPPPIFLKLNEAIPVPPVAVNKELVALNERNKLINNISYPNITIHSDDFKLGELQGQLLFEKELRFRMLIHSFLGLESDIGSNDDIFWFWSKRIDPPALFYAKHEDLYRTRLKTPFDPTWLKEIIGVSSLDLSKMKVYKQGDLLALVEEKVSILGESIRRIYLVDPVRLTFRGHYISKTNGSLVVSAEVLDYHEVDGYLLPKTLSINWVEEGLRSTWVMGRPIINTQINPSNWKCDDYKMRINLDGYAPRYVLVF